MIFVITEGLPKVEVFLLRCGLNLKLPHPDFGDMMKLLTSPQTQAMCLRKLTQATGGGSLTSLLQMR
jgi:hypothetical protein